MSLLQKLNCVLGKHERSRGRVRQDDNGFRSQCRGCSKPMIRTRAGWILDTGEALSSGSDA